jgi:hypothetical protein
MSNRSVLTEFFICECEDISHNFAITIDKWHDRYPPELYVSIHLNQKFGFFKRVWIAAKYVFGKTMPYGNYADTMVRPEDTYRIQDAITKYQTAVANYEEKPKC